MRSALGRPTALVLVRNTVSHDARVLREATVLGDLGYDVVVAGVVSDTEIERDLVVDGVRVVRVDPLGAVRGTAATVRRILRRGTAVSAAPSLPASREATGAPAATAGSRPARSARGTFRRLVVTLAYNVQAIWLTWRVAPSLVHANDYNTMWVALAAKLLGSRVVYDSHELWPDRNGRPELRSWLLACEALFVRLADATLTSSPGYAATIERRYRVAAPTVVRNIPAGRVMSLPRRTADGGPLAIYLGGVMVGRGIEQAIAALALAPELRLRVVGPGRAGYRSSLLLHARRHGVQDRLELRPAVEPDRVLDALAGADVGLMLIQPVCLSYELTLPNKLFEYAAAGLPILASDLPVIGPLVREEGIGESVPPEDVAAIARAMIRLSDPAVANAMRERALAFAARETWDAERTVLAGVYAAVDGPTSPGPAR